MKNDIQHRKWINVKFGFRSTAVNLIKNKRALQEYADELGWFIETDKEGEVDEQGRRLYDIIITPNKEKLISPEELRQVKDKLIGFASELLFIINPDATKALAYDYPVNVLEAKKPEDVILVYDLESILVLTYKLQDRIGLENQNLNLAKFVFGSSIKKSLGNLGLDTSRFHKLITRKKKIQLREQYKKRLKDWFGIDLE
ncbi:hypothetical protein LCGC14_1467130 [marine sediment metagenome]|uniref:Uncharacterized protein n=1 Tax=marine sediment metagenome TaxID=412755 RepID=A0A0F9JDH9_9ZZZZ